MCGETEVDALNKNNEKKREKELRFKFLTSVEWNFIMCFSKIMECKHID